MTNLKRAIAGVDPYADTTDPAKIERIQKRLDAFANAFNKQQRIKFVAERMTGSASSTDFLKDLFGIRK